MSGSSLPVWEDLAEGDIDQRSADFADDLLPYGDIIPSLDAVTAQVLRWDGLTRLNTDLRTAGSLLPMDLASDTAVALGLVAPPGSGGLWYRVALTIETVQSRQLTRNWLVRVSPWAAIIPAELINNQGILGTNDLTYPTDPAGLVAGDLWSNGGVIGMVGTTTPDPTAPPVFYGTITSAELLALGGVNLPQTDPGVDLQIWVFDGVLAVSLSQPA